jgi:hypothetical protein
VGQQRRRPPGRHHPGMLGEIILERRARPNRNAERDHRGFASDFWSYCPTDLRRDGLRCGIRRYSGGRAPGSGTRRSQHWDRLRVSRLRRSTNLRATCLLRSAPSLLQPTLCRLSPRTPAIQASLSPGTSLSLLLLLLLIPLCEPPDQPQPLFASGCDSLPCLILHNGKTRRR